MSKYLVTGATGQLGRLTLDTLAQKTAPASLAVLVRTPEAKAEFEARGFEAHLGNYNDPAALSAAMQGVDRVLLISSSEVGQRAPQHQNVINAAKASGVSFLAYTSILKAHENPMALAAEHKATEQMLAESGVPHAVLRNGWYTENHTASLAQVLSMGQQFGAAGPGRFSTAPRRDYAEAAAAVLTGEGHDGKIYELGGDSSYSLAEFAAKLGQLAGKEIAYVNLPQDAFAEALTVAGLPAAFAQVIAESDAHAAEGWLETRSTDLSRLINRPTTPVEETISAALAAM